jgi:glutathione S-transferase
MSSQPPVILFSYPSSPYGQKIHLLLAAAGIPYSELEQPPVLPRPDLEALDITYRRIPVLAAGRDVYADSSAIIDVILNQLGGKDKIATSKADKAFEVWGNSTFQAVLPLLPPQALDDKTFVDDRASIFPIIAKPELLKTMELPALADLKSRLATVEDVFLADGPYIGGDKISVADVHVIWVIRWVLTGRTCCYVRRTLKFTRLTRCCRTGRRKALLRARQIGIPQSLEPHLLSSQAKP